MAGKMDKTRQTWESYASSWKAETAPEKRALFELALEPGSIYQDPTTRAEGWDELLAYMQEFHQQIPGGSFRTVEFIAHHGQSMARWEMLDGEGKVIGTGTSHGLYAKSGKLTQMTGFFPTAQN
jgi:hypothetical protein